MSKWKLFEKLKGAKINLAKQKATDENIAKYFELHAELERLVEIESENFKTVKDRFGDRLIKRVNSDGKDVEVKENVLWQEVYELGIDCDAGKALEAKHPQVFEAAREKEKKRIEFIAFSVKEFNINPAVMSPSSLLNLILIATEYNLKKIIKENG